MDSLEERREQTIERLKKRSRITEVEIENVRTLLVRSPDLNGLARMDLVTEAVSENARTKLSVYRSLKAAAFTGLLTTNTSSVARATLLADGVCDPKNFALTHFFNPVLHTQMIEVVKGDMAEAQGNTVIGFLKGIGRQPVETRDISGFVSNGILMIYAVMDRLIEKDALIVNESPTSKDILMANFQFSKSRSYFSNSSGGYLGWGLGAAIGAKLASRNRRVVACLGDGSTMRTAFKRFLLLRQTTR